MVHHKRFSALISAGVLLLTTLSFTPALGDETFPAQTPRTATGAVTGVHSSAQPTPTQDTPTSPAPNDLTTPDSLEHRSVATDQDSTAIPNMKPNEPDRSAPLDAEPNASSSVIPIAEIQGTGAETPYAKQVVTTRGVVTASYPKGGFFGYFIQTPGTGGTVKTADASDGIFIYPGRNQPIMPIGRCVQITGTAGEYYGLTQISNVTSTQEISECEPVTAYRLESLPGEDAQREQYESMLLAPQGQYTVTDNYSLNKYGSVGLAFGSEPLVQATDAVRPGESAIAFEAENLKRFITLDDGSNWDYSKRKEAQSSPLPYLTLDQPVRVGAAVTFTGPVILDYRYGWNFQPLQQVVGLDSAPATFSNTRTQSPRDVGGDLRVATFNVLNYFTELGQDEAGCKGYEDREGNPITANRCNVRGAYRPADLQRQETKIVKAISALGADIVSLEEIENSSRFGKDRDAALAHLVEALNTEDGADTWAYVPSPSEIPNNGDAIRTAFIYRAATAVPVGQSLISDDPAFEGVARSPLAQRFSPVTRTSQIGTEFVLIVNHFKSKGSVLPGAGNEDIFDGQGANNAARVEQARALADFANNHFADLPVILVGDFNSYSQEDPMVALSQAGYTIQGGNAGFSYMYSGRVGSLDHVVANAAAAQRITGVDVWEINAHEPVALEYSRYNFNVTNLYAPDPFRSSDHNPKVFGLAVLAAIPTNYPTTNPLPTANPTITAIPTNYPTTNPLPTGNPPSANASGSPSSSVSAPKPTLPQTGANLVLPGMLALALCLTGTVLLFAARLHETRRKQ